MKSHNFLGLVFLVGLMAATAAIADTTSSTDDQTYRKSMEVYQANEEAYHNELVADEKTRQTFAVVAAAVVAGLIFFILIPAWREQRALTAIASQNQKLLEEIRDLLRKNAIEPNKSATMTFAGSSATEQPRAPASASMLLLRPR
jgi:Na+/H+-translocating membrane pyrophosphatase